ncbi:MAG: ASKHA domain-containing protein [Lachnospiraceae bacterium]|nr:ASKHA domain-containing protein [Lachnospiraceae bacterium]
MYANKKPPYCTGRINCGLCKDCVLSHISRETEILADYDKTSVFYRSVKNDHFIVDIGTTTLACEHIKDGRVIFSSTRLNSQSVYGADVVSRSEASIRGKREELADLLKEDLRALLKGSEKRPAKILIAGNTTIIHLLQGFDCSGLVNYPFTPVSLERQTGYIDDIPYETFPGISAYIGGDIAAGLYALGFHLNDKVCLFLDLGTNGEMALGNRDRILVASAAAGPAFEGTGLSNASDVISMIASLVEKGIIDGEGLLKEEYFDEGFPYEVSSERLPGRPGAAEGGDGSSVLITQKDIRDIQMAKSAIYAGVELLIKNYGISYDDIDKVYISGGMGHSLDLRAAVTVDFIDRELLKKTIIMGNTSLMGLARYSCEGEDRESADRIIRSSDEVILANEPDFGALYFEHMSFGPPGE